ATHPYPFSFFFSSRRRHTRSKRDWSSDVCSSDLDAERHDPHVFLLDTLGLLDRRLPLLAAAGLHHVERVEADHHASGDLERRDRDPKEAEDQATAQGEGREGHATGPGPAPGHEPPDRWRVACGHREEGR